MVCVVTAFGMSDAERRSLDEDGFVLREHVFDNHECALIAGACETMLDQLAAQKQAKKIAVGSYMFERQRELDTTIKWEPDAPDLVQGVEPFAHFCAPLRDWGLNPRLVDPCKAICSADELVLFTEKLNLKRAKKGGPIVLHQDFPYWEPFAPQARRVATAMIFLDDAAVGNGCLEVAPGSHKAGKYAQRQDVEGFGTLEMDADHFDLKRLVALEVKAGAVVYFGPFLVHRSLPNRSNDDRRALLYSYQPEGNPHAREMLNWRRPRTGDAEPTAAP